MDHVCRTCHHFASEPIDRRTSLGVCTHPDRLVDGVPILVYQQETRCRRGWGVDDWTPAGDRRTGDRRSDGVQPATPTTPDTDVVIDERPAPSNRPRRAYPSLTPIPIYLDRVDALAD